jgi:hypothetical protein
MHGKMNAYRVLVEKREGKKPLVRPRYMWVDNIKVELRKYDWVVWTGLIWLRIGINGRFL